MDCEKFENLLIDELYGELDEVTSAAVRRHAAGCARCGALLSGLRATRKVAALPIEEPSSDLEDRILSAVREQQKVLPLRARLAMGLSRAGAWAMRPQTAMAAVFLVVIGTSFVLVQGRKSVSTASMPAGGAFAEGAPVATAAAPPQAMASAYALDQRESAFAHGVEEKKALDESATITAAPTATMAANGPTDDLAKDKFDNDGVLGGNARGGGGAGGHMEAERRPLESANAAPIDGTRALEQPTQVATGASAADVSKTEVHAQSQQGASDPNTLLAAGRNEQAQRGCTPAAIQSFESARTRAPSGSAVANDATFRAAECYRTTGNTTLARARYSELLNKPGYQTMAQNGLDSMSPATAAHKAARIAPAPARAPQATDAQQQQRSGY